MLSLKGSRYAPVLRILFPGPNQNDCVKSDKPWTYLQDFKVLHDLEEKKFTRKLGET